MSPWSLPTFPSRRLLLRAAVARSSLCGDGTALHGNTMRGRCAAKSVCSVVARDVPAGPQGSLSVQRQPPWRRGRGAAERSPGDLRRPAELRGPVPRRPLALPPGRGLRSPSRARSPGGPRQQCPGQGRQPRGGCGGSRLTEEPTCPEIPVAPHGLQSLLGKGLERPPGPELPRLTARSAFGVRCVQLCRVELCRVVLGVFPSLSPGRRPLLCLFIF